VILIENQDVLKIFIDLPQRRWQVVAVVVIK